MIRRKPRPVANGPAPRNRGHDKRAAVDPSPHKDAARSGPLAGVRIVDMTTVMMGPYATQILADYGADVIKVEPPEGDIMRRAEPMRSPDMGAMYLQANRNKR